MEFNIGKKKVVLTKRQMIRGAIAFTAGAGAYVIVRQAVKTNVNSEAMNILGKTIVAVGAMFMANAVADKVQEHAGSFVDDCFEYYDKTQEATRQMMEDIQGASQESA